MSRRTSQFKTEDTEPTGFIRARDVRYRLKDQSVDPVVVQLLEAICEQAAHQEKNIASMAQILDRCVDICVQFEGVASNMKKAIQDMKTEMQVAAPELGPGDTQQ